MNKEAFAACGTVRGEQGFARGDVGSDDARDGRARAVIIERHTAGTTRWTLCVGGYASKFARSKRGRDGPVVAKY